VTVVIAHRGASRAWPDNTLAAFAAARDLGADGVELDVRPTADGALVVTHDPTYADGAAVAHRPAADRAPSVPLLAEALVACGDLVVNVEIKNDPAEPGFALDVADRVVGVLAPWPGRVIVSCFHLPTLDRVHALAPALPTGWLVVSPPPDWIERLHSGGHRALHPHHLAVTAELMRAARQHDIDINTWTIDDPRRMVELADLGANAIVTNIPDVALRVLGRS